MESLYARDTPTAQERKLKLVEREELVASQEGVQESATNDEQESMETFDTLMDTSTEATSDSSTSTAETRTRSTSKETMNCTDNAVGFGFGSLSREDAQQQLDEKWNRPDHEILGASDKTEEGRRAELSEDLAAFPSLSTSKKAEKLEVKTTENSQHEMTSQSRRVGVASVPRKPKPAITINTSPGSATIGAKRPPPTPVSPSMFSWNEILHVQNLIERCLQQYLSKNDILLALKEQANVDPAFANVVWQKLEEQNPTFFRAYSLQLQLKEQILAFNYLVGQQKEMMANGGKRVLHYSNMHRFSTSRAPGQCSLLTASAATTALPPINMDARTFLRTPVHSAKQQRTLAGKRAYTEHPHGNMNQLGSCSAVDSGTTSLSVSALPPPSPLPLPSPIKTDLDTHAFFT